LGGIVFHTGNSKAWLSRYHQFGALRLTLQHLTGGQPGRGSEESLMLIKNTATRRRNIYTYFDDQILQILGYSKTSGLTGKCSQRHDARSWSDRQSQERTWPAFAFSTSDCPS
jgi:hypothetical protein